MPDTLLHRVAADILRDHIENAQVRPGDRLPSIRALEQRYGASRSTIAQALNMLERRGVLAKRQGSGCYVAGPTQASGEPRSRPLGFVTPHTQSEVVLRVYDGIERVCRAHGRHVVVARSDDDYETERQRLHELVEAGCEAVVLCPVTRTAARLKADYLNADLQDVPIVLVDIAYRSQKRSQVVFDNRRAGREMTELLLRQGHRHIAFLDFDDDQRLMHFSTRERYRGYLDALRSARMPALPQYHWLIPSRAAYRVTQEQVAAHLAQWRDRQDRPTAVIAIEDNTAIQMIHAAQDLGMQVPADLAVVGFDNTAAGRAFRPAFPTTDPDFQRAGELAAEAAIEQAIGGRLEPAIYVLPLPILIRWPAQPIGSCDGNDSADHTVPTAALAASATNGPSAQTPAGR